MNGENTQTSMTNQEMQSALQTTMQMLRSDDVKTPNSWNKALADMEKLILAMLSGQLQLVPTAPPEGIQTPTGMPPGIPPEMPPGDDSEGKPN